MSGRGLPPRLLLTAGLRYQARHRWQAALALVGVIMGVAVVMAVDVANQAAQASFELSASQLRGNTTHRLVNPAGKVPEGLYAELATTPGAPPMAPVVQARVRVEGLDRRFRLVGLDIFAEGPFRGALPAAIQGGATLGDWLSDPTALLVSRAALADLGKSAGDVVRVRYEGRPYDLTVFAVADDESSGTRDLLVVDIATAQAITGQTGGLSYVDLDLAADKRAWISERLPPAVDLVDVDDQLEGVVGLSASFELNLTAMSLLALLVGLFLIFNAVSFSIVQRRNLFGRLRALGVRSDEIGRLVLAEALVVALIGTAVGVLLGAWLGSGLTAIVAATVSDLYYEVAAGATGVAGTSIVKAALLGIGGTLAASAVPAWQAARTPPLTTLSRAALEQTTRDWIPRLAFLGAGLAAAGLTIAFLAPGGLVAGFAGLFLALVGGAMLTPGAVRLAHRLLAALPLRGVWRMAARDLDRHLSRLGTAAAALMVALAASVGVAVMVESMRLAVSDWLDALLTADLYVAADTFVEGAPLPAEVGDGATRLAPVTAFSSYRDRRLQIDNRPLTLVAAHLAEPSRIGFDFVDAGPDPWRTFDDGGLLVSEPLANRLGLRAGEVLPVPTPRGEQVFTVAGVFRDFATEHGRIFMPDERYRQYWADPALDTLALFGTSPTALRDAVEASYGDRHDLAYTEARGIYDESMAVFDRTFRITEVLRLLSLAVAFVGIFSALMAVQIERRKEYAVLRALGLTRGQVARLIVIESAALGLIAGLVAIPAGLAMAWVLTDAIQVRAFGWTIPFTVDPWPLVVTVVLGSLAAVLAGLYPAWRSARHEPAGQLRED